MNIKRGVFRLWLITSVIWIAIVGITAQHAIQNEYSDLEAEQMLARMREIKMPRAAPDEVTIQGAIDEYARAQDTSSSLRANLRLTGILKDLAVAAQFYPVADRKEVRRLIAEHVGPLAPPPPGPDASFSERVRYRQLLEESARASPVILADPADPDRVVRDTAMLAVIPPLVLLIIGAAAYWALAGFRSEHKG